MTRFEKFWGVHTGKWFGSKIAWASRKEGRGGSSQTIFPYEHPSISQT